MSLPTPEQMWAQYLLGQTDMSFGDALLDEKFIRDSKATTFINISATDFMAGASRFMTGADFGVVDFFFTGKTPLTSNVPYGNTFTF